MAEYPDSSILMGPPRKGPIVRIIGVGIDTVIRVNDALDAQIVSMLLECAERRRYANAIRGSSNEQG